MAEDMPEAGGRSGGGFVVWAWGVTTPLLALASDQATKWWVVAEVMNPPRDIPVTPFFNLVLGWNRGVTFGLLSVDSPAAPWLLSSLALVIVSGLVVWVAHGRRHWTVVPAGLIIGGAVGNAIDRLRHGAVTDFLDFHAAGYHWPAFNLADAAIVTGVALLLLVGDKGRPERIADATGRPSRDLERP